ncbi:uncharacterized protein LOC110457344 [Mizuhopecten yessoensis]|uniref:Zinc finger protein 26 n=1 Tax=Mizuhopecten yessoensis TaxID=6573 RepID=A0A210Q8X4_MIZYE|nr:uncharacterized protein LOC110457344 [Mizuhopecten yessoensis]OWF45176.1 Zinc finger protein 26 [Mizuhopecten yessoensis]
MDVRAALIEVCDVCGSQHPTEACPELGLDTSELTQQTRSRARLTLPEFLFEVEIAGEVGVFTRDTVLQKKTQFGPFEAKKTTHEFNDESLFILKVTTKDGTCISLDTTSENDCNWMCLVRAALTYEQQNCIAYQLGTNLYYSTTKDIAPGSELCVWYAPAYARRIGKPEKPDGVSKVMLGMKVIYPSVEDLPDAPQTRPQTDNLTDEESEVPQALKVEIKPNFLCKRCGEGFHSESDLALHLRNHIIPNYYSVMNGKQRKRGRPAKALMVKKRGRKPKKIMVEAKRLKLDSPEECESEAEAETVDGMESMKDEGEQEESSDEEFTPVILSTSPGMLEGGRRIQPRRSLKGVRTSGFEADENFVYMKIKTEKPDDGYDVSPSKPKNKNIQGKNVIDETIAGETAVIPKHEKDEDKLEAKVTPVKRKRGRPPKVKRTEHSEVKNSHETPCQTHDQNLNFNADLAGTNDTQQGLIEKSKTSTGKTVEQRKDDDGKTLFKADANEKDVDLKEKEDEKCVTPANVADEKTVSVIEGSKDSCISQVKEKNENQPCQVGSGDQDDSIASTKSVQELENGIHQIVGKSKEEGNLSTYTETLEVNCITEKQSTSKTMAEEPSSDLIEPMEEHVEDTDSHVDLESSQAGEHSSSNVNAVGIHMPSDESIANMAVDDDLQNILDQLDKTDGNVQRSMDKETDVAEKRNELSDKPELMENKEEATKREKEAAADKDTQTPDDDVDERSIDDNDDSSNSFIKTDSQDEDKNDDTTLPFHNYVAKLVKQTDELEEENHAEFVNDEVAKFLLTDNFVDEVDSKDDYTKYMKIEDTSDGKHFICTLCEKKFLHEKYLRLHFPAHTGKFKCRKCGAKFCRNDTLKRHNCSNANKGTKPHEGPTQSVSPSLSKCDICDQQFTNEKYLFRHMAIHTNIFQCLNCHKSFSRKDSLQRHILKCCPEDAEQYQVFFCRKCQKTFATKLGRDNHETHCKQKMCEQCQSVFASENLFLAHKCQSKKTETRRNVPVKYNCSQCPKSFRNLNYLKQHLQIHEGGFICQLCGRKLKTKEEQDDHERMCMALSVIQNEGKTKCMSCDLFFTDIRSYKEHYHSHTHPYQCSKCQKRFVKIGSLHSHVCTLDDDNNLLFSCNICHKDFRNERLLIRHREMHQEHRFKCQHCDKKFFRRDYYLKHVCKDADGTEMDVDRNAEIRAQQDKLVCHICGKNFVSSSNLNKHMKVHGEKTCICHICSKRFHYVEYLRVHLEGFHNKKHQFQCSECGKILTSKPGLTSHVKQFHSDEKEAHPCPTCGKIFSQKGNMKTHMYSHTKERGFQCTFCTKAFKYPDQLNRHKLIHTMQNKLECDHCDKKFTKLYDLKKHFELFHSGMMYVCEVCGARTGHRHTMVRHYKRKHPETAEQAKEPSYLDSLFKHIDKEPDVTTEEIIEDHLIADGIHVDNVSNLICSEEFVPQTAAEVLQSLSNTGVANDQPIIVADGTTVIQNADGTISMPGQEGTFSIQNIQQAVEGPDGQSTVVILQFVSQQEQDGVTETHHQEVQVQELDTQVITAGAVEATGEVETYIQSYVVSD